MMNNYTYNKAKSLHFNKRTKTTRKSSLARPEVTQHRKPQTAASSEQVFTTPTTLASALMLAAELEGKRLELTQLVEKLKNKIAEDAEKVEFYNDMTGTDELFNTGVVAKTLGTGKTRFLNYLHKHKILMGTGNKRNLPYQQHLDAGRLDVAWVKCVDRHTGESKIKPVPLFTGKGVIWIEQFITKHGRDGL